MHLSAHPALHSSVAQCKGDISVPRLDKLTILIADKVGVPFRVPPPELTFVTGDQAPQREFTVPTMTILALQHPGLCAPRFGRANVFTHQTRKASPIFAGEPIAEFPERGAINPGEERCSLVSVLVEIRPGVLLTLNGRFLTLPLEKAMQHPQPRGAFVTWFPLTSFRFCRINAKSKELTPTATSKINSPYVVGWESQNTLMRQNGRASVVLSI